MDQDHLRTLLEQVRAGAVEIDAALERLRHLPYEDLGFAKVDHHRALRHGMPEVIFGKGKTPDQISAIVNTLLATSQNVLAWKANTRPQGSIFLPPAQCDSGGTGPRAAKEKSRLSAPAPATSRWPKKRRSPPR